ncbi:Na+/serine symporter [Ewingella americana]
MQTQSPPSLIQRILHASLVKQILFGLLAGIALAWLAPGAATSVGLLGSLFVGALKAVAPLLVLVLVTASIMNHPLGRKTVLGPILFLYLFGTFSAALIAVVVSFMFPSTLDLKIADVAITPPGGIVDVLKGLIMSIVSNPFKALIDANYIGILAWAIGLGLAMRHAAETSKAMISDVSEAVTKIVRVVIRFAPLGDLWLGGRNPRHQRLRRAV